MRHLPNCVLFSLLIVISPGVVLAAGHRIVVMDKSETVTTNGSFGGIYVQGTGTIVRGDNVTIRSEEASSTVFYPNNSIFAIKSALEVQKGAIIELTNSSIESSIDNSRVLTSLSPGSLIRLSNTYLTMDAIGQMGVMASNGGSVELLGGSARMGEGAVVFLDVTYPDSTVIVSDYKMFSGGSNIQMLTGNGASLILNNTALESPEQAVAAGAFNKGRFTMVGSSIVTGKTGLILFPYDGSGQEFGLNGTGGLARISHSSIKVTGSGGVGVNMYGKDAIADIDYVSITTLGEQGEGIRLSANGTALDVTNFQIHSSNTGVDNGGGVVTLSDGSVTIEDDGGFGLLTSDTEYGDEARLQATRVSVETRGDESSAITGIGANVDITLDTVAVTSHGDESVGLEVNAGSLAATGSTVDMKGADSIAAGVLQGGSMTLDHTSLHVTEGKGIDSVNTKRLDIPPPPSTIIIRNGSEITVDSGAAMNAFGGSHVFQVSNSRVSAQTGALATGILLQTGGIINGYDDHIRAGQIRLDASNALLIGDVTAYDGAIDISLKQGSVLTGALKQNGDGRINGLTLDGTSAWMVRGDSRLGTLNNGGSVAFAAPADAAGFKTLTVNDYAGGGALLLHTRLGGDSSPTDRLVIDGGAASGGTALRIVNAGGNGGRTARGIRVVETVNGGTTTPDAFRLDSASTGYRTGSGTLSINGYDYSLVRGGDANTAADWFLSSGGPGFTNLSPEGGAYAGNRQAAVNLFSHSAHDRVPAYASGNDAGAQARRGRRLWLRVQGRHDEGLRLSEGRVDVDTDIAMLQLGGDLLATPAGGEGAVHVGLMGGYGDARSRSVSTLALSGGQRAHAQARGKVSGYAAGLYATWYQNALTRRGAWADAWVQYGRYTNQLSSELGAADYRSDTWSASVEAGYAFQPFAGGALLKTLVVEPHAQMIYDRYRAADAVVSDLRLRSGACGNWQSRIGARLHPDAANTVIRPFLEANWLHASANPVVRMGDTSLRLLSARNAFEVKAGAQARVGTAWRLSAQVFEQSGNGSPRSYGGSVNVSYRW